MLYTAEHIELQRSVKKFVETEINPYVEEWEDAQIFPAHEVFKKLGNAGFLGINKPTEYGGLGLDYSYAMAFAEAVGASCDSGGIGMAIGVQTDMATPALARFGSDELRREFLAPAIAGDYVAAIGVSEPGAGSDVAAIKTTARKDGDDYVINGTKMWITNGTQADWICLLANTGEGPIHKNKSLICVPLKTPGVSVAKKIKKLGMWASDTAQLYFDEVRVPQRYRIGEEGAGFVYQMQQFQEERLFAATTWAVLDRAINLTIEYTRDRQAFGKSLLDNQYINFRLAELKVEVEALKSLTHRAAEAHLRGKDVTLLASMAKFKTGRLAREIPDACLQFWGGMGYSWESKINRIFRDTRLSAIGGGADEVMLGIITKLLGTAPKHG